MILWPLILYVRNRSWAWRFMWEAIAVEGCRADEIEIQSHRHEFSLTYTSSMVVLCFLRKVTMSASMSPEYQCPKFSYSLYTGFTPSADKQLAAWSPSLTPTFSSRSPWPMSIGILRQDGNRFAEGRSSSSRRYPRACIFSGSGEPSIQLESAYTTAAPTSSGPTFITTPSKRIMLVLKPTIHGLPGRRNLLNPPPKRQPSTHPKRPKHPLPITRQQRNERSRTPLTQPPEHHIPRSNLLNRIPHQPMDIRTRLPQSLNLQFLPLQRRPIEVPIVGPLSDGWAIKASGAALRGGGEDEFRGGEGKAKGAIFWNRMGEERGAEGAAKGAAAVEHYEGPRVCGEGWDDEGRGVLGRFLNRWWGWGGWGWGSHHSGLKYELLTLGRLSIEGDVVRERGLASQGCFPGSMFVVWVRGIVLSELATLYYHCEDTNQSPSRNVGRHTW